MPSWWPFGGKEKAAGTPEAGGGVNAQTLADFTRGIQHAINAALDVAQDQHQREVGEHFEESGDPPISRPKTKVYELRPGVFLELPTLVMSPMWALQPKTMKVRMSVRINRSEIKKIGPAGASTDCTRASFHVSLAPSGKKAVGESSSVVRLEMTFVAGEQPEGVGRLMEYLTNAIQLEPRPKALPPPAAPEKEPPHAEGH